MTLQQLRYFTAAICDGTLSAAAKSCDSARTLSDADRLRLASLDPPIFERFVSVQHSRVSLSPAVAALISRMRTAPQGQSIEQEVDV